MWGDLSRDELSQFGLLALTFFFTIGSFWLFKVLKDGIFSSTVGMIYQPEAKILTAIILVPLILLYAKLVDTFPKDKLFYVICCFYGVIFLFIAYLLSSPNIGIANTVKSPFRLIGWTSYILIEVMGSMIIALFWSFVSSCVGADGAKKGYALIISGGQFGGIFGPTIATYSTNIGLPLLLVIASITIFIIPLMIKIYTSLLGHKEVINIKVVNKKKTGVFEGLKLLLSRPYLLGIFAITTFYEVISVIIDYQMKILAEQKYLTAESYTAFMGLFGQYVNIITFSMALLGTSILLRKLGLTFCLLIFPLSIGLMVSNVYFNPSLTAAFVAMIVIKSLSFSLNNPSKEMLYIPTTNDIRFKTKSWVDMFGSRGAKSVGSGINTTFSTSIADLMFYGSLIAMGLVGIWIVAAIFVGNRFKYLVKENKIVE